MAKLTNAGAVRVVRDLATVDGIEAHLQQELARRKGLYQVMADWLKDQGFDGPTYHTIQKLGKGSKRFETLNFTYVRAISRALQYFPPVRPE